MIALPADLHPMPDSLTRIACDYPAGVLTLTRPRRRNALSRRLLAAISEGLDDLHGERKVRAVILTGEGDDFCAGADLAEIHECQQDEDAWRQWHEDAVNLRDFVERLLQYPKPLIAAVTGTVAGLGVALTLCCDVVLAAENTRFTFPEITRGLSPGVAAPLLAFRVGGSHAARLMLTAATVDANQAQRIGLCHQVVEGETLLAQAKAVADQVARGSPEAVQLTRKLLNETVAEGMLSMLSAGVAAMATARTTESAVEGVKAFIEKRKPEWP